MSKSEIQSFLARMRACELCRQAEKPLPHAPNPVFQMAPTARILVAGQAPGNLANQTTKTFNDPSGVRLRDWMGIDDDIFYDARKVAVLPMGFCFPGYAPSGGDLPPRKECAPHWRQKALDYLPNIEVTLLIGGYAQAWHLKDRYQGSVTRTVEHWQDYAPSVFPVPHPSWRNNAWLKKHPWFETDLLPELRAAIGRALSSSAAES
ncbi:uracil-DNA glycosylase family protein [Ponticaulis profundi]|uniref:Uracil-DNA glycosylase family protein n=1 Tax=Ponticaulis profundi TaxID=2665222 RepID=A0ABW1SEM3_9PROT